MMGVPISGPFYMFGDNMSIIHNTQLIHNTQRPESTLKKKSNSICYHTIREVVAMGEIWTAHVSTNENPADICTNCKVLPGGAKRYNLISLVMHDICDYGDTGLGICEGDLDSGLGKPWLFVRRVRTAAGTKCLTPLSFL
jgi:hypothetical protein